MNYAPTLMLAFISTFAAQSIANPPCAWELWDRGLERSCPDRHVQWVADGGYLDLLAAFEATLPQQSQAQVRRGTDFKHRCASEEIGFACEMGVSLEMYRSLGLLDRFISFGCSHVRCEEPALCSQFPRAAAR
jgi:hypothetical protein